MHQNREEVDLLLGQPFQLFRGLAGQDKSWLVWREGVSGGPNTYVDEVRLFTSTSQGVDCYIDELTIVP